MNVSSEYQAKYHYIGNVAEQYDARRMSNPKWQREQDAIANLTGKFDPGSVVLDVPLGTGRFMPIYAEMNLKVVGLDISLDMLRQADKKNGDEVRETTFVQGDSEVLPLRTDAVDYVLCARLLNWVPPSVLSRILAEFTRVARKGIVVEIRLHEEISFLRAFSNFTNDLRRQDNLSASRVRRMLRRKGSIDGYVLHEERFVQQVFAQNRLCLREVVRVDERTDYFKRDFQPYLMYFLGKGEFEKN